MRSDPLRALQQLRNRFGAEAAGAKCALLKRLTRTRLRTARELERLHELLCFMRAYPDDARLLAIVRRMLAGFARRADLRTQREALESSGIAGSAIRFPFFWPSARWLARRWPGRITLDRLDRAAGRSIGALLGVDRRRLSGFAALDRLRPRRVSDAVHFIRLVEAMPGDEFAKEAFYDAIEPVIEIHPARGTPNRTLAWHATGPIVWQRASFDRARPDLAAEIRRPPHRVRHLSAREGERLLDLARAAMATRSRDLDAFAYGDARELRLVEDGGGLAFALNGVIASRHPAHATPYGALTLMNGVPIGYLQLDIAARVAAVSFNTFPTFRDGEAARVFGRALAMARHVLGARAFSIEPYQLGQGNREAIESGAWWFYFKLGFRPRNAAVRRLARRELARLRAAPGHRSSKATLTELARAHLYFAPRRR